MCRCIVLSLRFIVWYFISDARKCTGPRKHCIRIPPERPWLTCAQYSTPETKIKREQTGKYKKRIKLSTNANKGWYNKILWQGNTVVALQNTIYCLLGILQPLLPLWEGNSFLWEQKFCFLQCLTAVLSPAFQWFYVLSYIFGFFILKTCFLPDRVYPISIV